MVLTLPDSGGVHGTMETQAELSLVAVTAGVVKICQAWCKGRKSKAQTHHEQRHSRQHEVESLLLV